MKLFLFGAGASIPFFKTPLTTNYITQEISVIRKMEANFKILLGKITYSFSFRS